MVISAKIASAGDRWFPCWPHIDLVKCFPKIDGREMFDEDEFRRQIKNCDMVQISGDDRGTPCAFGAILISSVCDWLDDNDKSDAFGNEGRRIKARIDRRLDRGKVTYCRIVITGAVREWKGELVKVAKVKITTDDKGVVEVQKFEREFAMLIADFVRCYSIRYVERGDPPILLSKETVEIMNELHERTLEDEKAERLRKLNGERLFCKNHVNGFCSPVKLGCPCLKDGRCVECKEL